MELQDGMRRGLRGATGCFSSLCRGAAGCRTTPRPTQEKIGRVVAFQLRCKLHAYILQSASLCIPSRNLAPGPLTVAFARTVHVTNRALAPKQREQ